MIAFGAAITDPGIYARFAEPGIRLAAEPESEIVSHASDGSIFRNYNLMLDMVANREDLEALVLIHQDAELVDRDFCQKVRRALREPDVAIVGCAGAVGVRSIAWWMGSVTWASFTHRYYEFGGGEIPALTWKPDEIPSYAQRGEVDAIDGVVMVMSPWAVRKLRFDESLGQLHGYDFDMCMQARSAGKKVVTEDLRVVHHHSLNLMSNVDGWVSAHIRIAEKWDGRLPGVPGCDWRERALKAEAESDASKLLSLAADQIRDARAEYDAERVSRLEDEVALMQGSTSWRTTAPFRAIGRFVRRIGRGATPNPP